MAKVAFSKLKLKKQEDVKTITINDVEITVKQYLPIEDKLTLIAAVLNQSHDTNYANPIKIEVIGTLEIIYAYTNLSFTDKQKEDPGRLYDLLDSNGIINQIIAAIPSEEYKFLLKGIDETITAVYAYQNSVLGILESVSQDYSALELDANNINQQIANSENLNLLREVLTKLG